MKPFPKEPRWHPPRPVQRIHQHGNGTRYDLWFSGVAKGKMMVSWAFRGGSGGTFMIVNSPVHPSYVEEKMNICNAFTQNNQNS